MGSGNDGEGDTTNRNVIIGASVAAAVGVIIGMILIVKYVGNKGKKRYSDEMNDVFQRGGAIEPWNMYKND
jgi:hypothetical protein